MLEGSLAFQAPDAADRLAAALGVDGALRGSLLQGAGSATPGLRAARLATRAWLARAWSNEALARGVQLARQRRPAQEVLPQYRKALELDGTNADAHVALGAALANCFHWQEAAAALRRALEIDPGHANGASYLRRVEAKALEAGVRLPLREPEDAARGEALDCLALAPDKGAQTPSADAGARPSQQASGGATDEAAPASGDPSGPSPVDPTDRRHLNEHVLGALQVVLRHKHEKKDKKRSRKEEKRHKR